jgi:hypothetical protein
VAAVVLAALAGALLVSGAGAAGAGGDRLPPSTLAKLKRLYDPAVERFGLRVSRGMLQDIETYQVDPEGTHLALYVEPVKDNYDDARYVANFTKLTRTFVPKVFRQYPGLESFDICQEPYADPAEAPPPVTQIFVSRDALDRVGNWRTADLTQLLAASPRVRSVAAGYYVYFTPDLRDDPAYVAAAQAAGWTSRPPSSPTSTTTSAP